MKRRSALPPAVVNGWTLFFHEHLLDQLERSTAAAAPNKTRQAGAANKRGTPTTENAKVLRAIHHLVFDEIPKNPNRANYRQKSTLGAARAHWFRA